MADYEIVDFNIRASYPNYFTINCFVKKSSNVSNEILKNYLNPEVEYVEHMQTKVIEAHLFDVPFLSQQDIKARYDYLKHLIKKQNGDKESSNYIEKSRLKYKNQKLEKIENLSFTENDYIIPSSTNHKYSEELISQKGAILLDLTQRLFPVPDFCVLTSKAFFLENKEKEVYLFKAIENLEKMTCTQLGDSTNPLIFAMRAATSFYIPGFLPTYLNVGINERVYDALKNKYGIVVAGKIYMNNLQTIYKVMFPEDAGSEICNPVTSYFSIIELERKISILMERIGKENRNILNEPLLQVSFLETKIKDFFIKNQDLVYTLKKGEISYPSIIMQKMVWTIRNDDSYPGVLYSRHSRTGLGNQMECVRNIFGDDIMTGNIDRIDTEYFDREDIRKEYPSVYHFTPSLPKLEALHGSPVTIEFAAETRGNVHLFSILQLNASELTGRSILLSAIEMYNQGVISGEQAVKLIQPYHLKQIFSERIDDKFFNELTFFSRGISVLPRSAVTARIFFSTSKAMEAKRKGEKVCLCKETFVPSDTIVLKELDAIVSLTPAAVHVVTSCLGYGVPAFINLYKYHVKLINNSLENISGFILNEGDWITLSSKHKTIYIGKAKYASARFQKYIEGEKMDLLPKEEKVFLNMKEAYNVYQHILETLDSDEISSLNDLIKIIRNDLQKNQKKAALMANNWFDNNITIYIEHILKSELGTHQDQHMCYKLFTVNRKIQFFKAIINICLSRELKGYTAGSFMLGRFICLQHPVSFWRKMTLHEIVFLLNEYILFEKYLQVLYDIGERHINRARKKILNEGINNINLSQISPINFITLKLVFKDWKLINKSSYLGYDPSTFQLIKLLKQPFGSLYDYDAEWSINMLKKVCDNEKIPLPDKNSI